MWQWVNAFKLEACRITHRKSSVQADFRDACPIIARARGIFCLSSAQVSKVHFMVDAKSKLTSPGVWNE
ncbi:hypothetical protein CBM2631_A300106 [Cupriavidus taiwanensis]|nr:hypothetical protein CBM2618_A270106 [Cupriavidus taiwanensis]SOZ81005.1 hypothetical protein CBM2622_A240104 [Cupriavidus taiwanensis]SPA15417.1 hypothetical protein CBM2631_A300106 [Cupriavidus taiwanensis]